MQLLIKREQHSSIARPVFKLWAKFELREDEHALITKYKVSKTVLTEGNTRRDITKAVMYSVAICLVGYIVISIFGMSINLAELILAIPLLTLGIYNRI